MPGPGCRSAANERLWTTVFPSRTWRQEQASGPPPPRLPVLPPSRGCLAWTQSLEHSLICSAKVWGAPLWAGLWFGGFLPGCVAPLRQQTLARQARPAWGAAKGRGGQRSAWPGDPCHPRGPSPPRVPGWAVVAGGQEPRRPRTWRRAGARRAGLSVLPCPPGSAAAPRPAPSTVLRPASPVSGERAPHTKGLFLSAHPRPRQACEAAPVSAPAAGEGAWLRGEVGRGARPAPGNSGHLCSPRPASPSGASPDTQPFRPDSCAPSSQVTLPDAWEAAVGPGGL